MRRYLHDVLLEQGYDLRIEENPRSAEQVLIDHNPELVLLDDAAVCVRLRAMAEANLLPVLFVSTHITDEVVDRAFAAGATDMLILPLHDVVVLQRVGRWLHTHQTERELMEHNRFLELMNRVGQAASSSLELREMVTEIVSVIATFMDVTSTYILEYDVISNSATVLTRYISPYAMPEEEGSDIGDHYSLDHDPRFRLALILVNEGFRQAHFDSPDLLESERMQFEEFNVKSILKIPIYVELRMFGYFELWESRRKRVFRMEEIEAMQAVARQIGNSINNAQLYTRLRESESNLRRAEHELIRRNRILVQLNRASGAAVSSVELHEILARTIAIAADAMQFTNAFIFDYEPDSSRTTILAEYVAPFAPDYGRHNSVVGLSYQTEQYRTLHRWLSEPSDYTIVHA
ncbi:MAG TPA: GAF domain-containing protein, partial [Aggregatilineales bacterium]|nr:GAF domain-containing protein [Aggregatilineales bacterium]